jgi:hypothetical protein
VAKIVHGLPPNTLNYSANFDSIGGWRHKLLFVSGTMSFLDVCGYNKRTKMLTCRIVPNSWISLMRLLPLTRDQGGIKTA